MPVSCIDRGPCGSLGGLRAASPNTALSPRFQSGEYVSYNRVFSARIDVSVWGRSGELSCFAKSRVSASTSDAGQVKNNRALYQIQAGCTPLEVTLGAASAAPRALRLRSVGRFVYSQSLALKSEHESALGS